MGTVGFMKLGVLIIFLQTLAPGSLEEPTCPGFEADLLIFKVERMRLHMGQVLGKVGFDCSGRTRFLFDTDDTRFRVEPDGTLKLKRVVTLHSGHKDFSVHAWDSQGRKRTVLVRVQMNSRKQHPHQNQHHLGHQNQHHLGHQNQHHHGHQNQHHHGHQDQDRHDHQNHNHHGHQKHHGHQNHSHHGHHHGHQNHSHHGHHHGHQNHSHSHHGQHQEHQPSEVVTHTQSPESPAVPVLLFPKASAGLKRRKRAWVIPPINVAENSRGPFPKLMVQIRSSNDKEVTVHYSIVGPGADQPPEGLFTIDRNSGVLYVTQPLDREKQDKYKVTAHAVAEGQGVSEEPMDIIINVIDMNDNRPVFTMDPFLGTVPEASPIGFEIMKVVAMDADEPGSANSDVRYEITSQEPKLPSPNMFTINPVNGGIRVNAANLDRENFPKYTLEIQAADMEGTGLTTRGKVIITVSDSNDNAPEFVQKSYTATVPENQVDALVAKMQVTDGDEPHSSAWAAVFSIVAGDPDGLFSVTTGANKQEGIITTAKALDFEKNPKYTLLVNVVNEVPFATRMPTSTATVIVTVQDVNEAPVFNPVERLIVKKEDLAVNTELVLYTATDPDTARKQTITYKIQNDPAGWLNVKKETGMITVKSPMDRESHFVTNGKYIALIAAIDNDEIPATGTGTLLIQLEDVNDNAPIIQERTIDVCNKEPTPQHLTVTDKDGPGFTTPYTVSLEGMSKTNWTARMNESKTGIILTLNNALEQGYYTVVLRVSDNQGMEQDSTLQAHVCDCTGGNFECQLIREALVALPGVLGILGAILLLLLLGLILLMFMRRRRGEKKEPLLQDDDVRDNIYYYDEEGGGEDDQDYDLSVLHRGLDNRPDVFRNDVVPTFMPAPQYRPRPANPEDIGCFIDDNLKAADNDPTAPPYDSLLVFDYEGGGSEAGSLSSLNSSSSGDDQDYDVLLDWGPRFKKLADMYGGGEEEML